MELIIIWLGFAVVTAVAASSRGRDPLGWFILGFLFGPFGLIAVLVMSPVQKNGTGSETSDQRFERLRRLGQEMEREQNPAKAYPGIKKDRICPHCQTPIDSGTPKCPECGATLIWRRVEGTGVLTPSVSHAPEDYKPKPSQSDEKVCPDCAEIIKAAAKVCRYCGYRFEL